MSRGPMTVLYLGEAALMVAVPADLLTELVEAASDMAEHNHADTIGLTDKVMRLIEAVAAIEELEGS